MKSKAEPHPYTYVARYAKRIPASPFCVWPLPVRFARTGVAFHATKSAAQRGKLRAMETAPTVHGVVTTTVRVWAPAVAHLRGAPSGASGAAVEAAVRALGARGYRWPIPGPSRSEVDALAAAGTALNTAVRTRYVRGGSAGAIGPAALALAQAAEDLAVTVAHPVSGPGVCVGGLRSMVKVSLDRRLHAAMLDAAAANRMRFGGWVRDSLAAALGEHQARRPSTETRDARAGIGRAAGLVVQAGDVAADDEVAAVAAADAALAAAAARLLNAGSRR